MPVALRLARTGVRHQTLFTIVAANVRSPRDGKRLENVSVLLLNGV